MTEVADRYPAFPHIRRLFRSVIVTEKLDGTNGLVHVAEDGTVRAGSRNRWLYPGAADNFGFGNWVQEHKDELRELGPGHHYGEWWGKGIQRGYGLDERRFSLFNVGRWGDGVINVKDDGTWRMRPTCCHVVPVLFQGETFDTVMISAVLSHLKLDGSYAAPGFMQPEGVVVFHEASNHLYKVTLGDDGHKGT